MKIVQSTGYIDSDSSFEGAPVNAGLTRYTPFYPQGVWTVFFSEVLTSNALNYTGTISDLQALIVRNTADRTSTLKLRDEGADANQSVSIGASTTGVFHDSSNTDTITSGNKYNYQLIAGGSSGSISFAQISSIVDTEDNITRVGCGGSSNFSANTDYFNPFAGRHTTTSAAISVSTLVLEAATLKNLALYVSSNSTGSATVHRIQITGVNGNCSISVPANTTGYFEDLVNSDVLSANDLPYFMIDKAAVGTFQVFGQMVDYELTDKGILMCCQASNNIDPDGAFVGGDFYFSNIMGAVAGGGDIEGDNTEDKVQLTSRIAFTAQGMTTRISANFFNAGVTLHFRVNGVSTDIDISIPSSTSGHFSNTADTADVEVEDLINYMLDVSARSSGTAEYHSNTLLYSEAAAPTGPLSGKRRWGLVN